MTRTRRRSPLPLILALALVTGAFAVYEENTQGIKVTFDVRLGDGYSWAGDAGIVYVIGGRSQPVSLQALPQGDHRVNTWRVTKTVKPPVALALSATPGWQGVPVTVVIRGKGITARPVTAVGRATAATSYFLPG